MIFKLFIYVVTALGELIAICALAYFFMVACFKAAIGMPCFRSMPIDVKSRFQQPDRTLQTVNQKIRIIGLAGMIVFVIGLAVPSIFRISSSTDEMISFPEIIGQTIGFCLFIRLYLTARQTEPTQQALPKEIRLFRQRRWLLLPLGAVVYAGWILMDGLGNHFSGEPFFNHLGYDSLLFAAVPVAALTTLKMTR